jgi:hypothetical protein
MIFTAENTKGKNVRILDNMGRLIPKPSYFDTETCEIEFFVTDEEGRVLSEITEDGSGQAKKVKTIWRGAYAELDGNKV